MDGDKSPEGEIGGITVEDQKINPSSSEEEHKVLFDPLRMREYQTIKRGNILELVDPKTHQVVGRRQGPLVITGEYDSDREDYIEEKGPPEGTTVLYDPQSGVEVAIRDQTGQIIHQHTEDIPVRQENDKIVFHKGFDPGRTDYKEQKIKESHWVALKDPHTNEIIAWRMEIKGGAGVIPDPEAADLVDSATARRWVEKVLRSFERNEDRKITSNVEDSLTATIASKIPVGILDPATGLVYTHVDPGGRSETLGQELIRLVEARVAYHNSSLSARLGLVNLGEEYGGITLNEHMEIFDTPGVKEAIHELESRGGEYYRLTGAAINTEQNRIRNLLRAAGIGNPANTHDEDDEASLALELAERTMHIHGESGYYTGIWDIHGNNIRFTGPDMLEQYANYFENHWDEIAFYRDPTSGTPLVDTRGGLPGVAVTPETLPEYIDYIRATVGPAAAAALTPLAGGTSWNQLSGEGALHQKGTYHIPLFLENPLTPFRGSAPFLRRYTYSWVSSGVRFSRNPTDPAAHTSMIDAINNYGRDWAKWFIWTARASGAHKGRAVFAEKGTESILNNPLIDANAVNTQNSHQTLPKSLENFVKAKEAYAGLPAVEQQRATVHLLRGLLVYVNSAEARAEGFSFSGWNDSIRRNAINWVVSQQLITNEQAAQLIRDLGISENQAALREGTPQYGEAGTGLFSGFLRGIFRR